MSNDTLTLRLNAMFTIANMPSLCVSVVYLIVWFSGFGTKFRMAMRDEFGVLECGDQLRFLCVVYDLSVSFQILDFSYVIFGNVL